MLKGGKSKIDLVNRFIDFFVFGLALLTSYLLLSVDLESTFIIHVLVYSFVLLIFVRRCKVWLSRNNGEPGSVTQQIIGNAMGITLGTCVVLLIDKITPGGGETVLTVVLSGVLAFFVLGTLSPLIHKHPPQSR